MSVAKDQPKTVVKPRHWTPRLLSWLVFALPFAVAACFLGPSPGWLDAPELVGASASLGLSHPPGHPSYLLLSHLASLIPFGSIPFRLGLFSALCYGLMAWLSYRAALHLCAIVLGEACLHWWTRGLVLVGIWLGCFQFTTMAQAVRPEVYTFHAALAFAAIERLLAAYRLSRLSLSADEPWPLGLPHSTHRALLQAGLWFGLGLANHHFLTFLLLPGALLLIFVMWQRKAIRMASVGWAFALALLGLSTYAYMPVRSVQAPAIHWGVAHTPSALTWQITAQIWQRSVQTNRTQSMSHRALLLLTIYVEQWGLWLLFFLIGVYILFRLSRLMGCVFLLWFGGQLFGRWIMVVERQNLDLHGYLSLSMLLVGWALAFVCVWLSEELAGAKGRAKEGEGFPPAAYQAAQGGIVLLLLLPFPLALNEFAEPNRYTFSRTRCDHRGQLGPLLWSRLMEEPLPYGAILVTNYYQHGFLRWYRKVIERHRPDVVLLQRNLLLHRYISGLEKARNPLAKKVDFSLGDGSDAYRTLGKLSGQRSVCFEWDPTLPKKVIRALYPFGAFFCWNRGRSVEFDLRGRAKDDDAIREQQQHFWREVYAMMKPIKRPEQLQTEILLYTHFRHALFYLKTHRWQAGLQELRLARRLSPRTASLRLLATRFAKQMENAAQSPPKD